MTKSRYFGHDFNELKREHLTISVKKNVCRLKIYAGIKSPGNQEI
ncbi:MAG: hypothetical protein ACRD5E_09435 [Nitrososphaeraceae archaeon]